MPRQVARNRKGRMLVALVALVATTSIVAVSSVTALAALGETATFRGAEAGRPSKDPATFMKRVVGQIVGNDYARAWLTLLPAHQRVASRSEYVGCEMLTSFTAKLLSVETLSVRDVRMRIAGVARPVAAMTVRLRVTTVESGMGASTGIVTAHAVPVNGSWRWVLAPERYELYRVGGCTPAPAP